MTEIREHPDNCPCPGCIFKLRHDVQTCGCWGCFYRRNNTHYTELQHHHEQLTQKFQNLVNDKWAQLREDDSYKSELSHIPIKEHDLIVHQWQSDLKDVRRTMQAKFDSENQSNLDKIKVLSQNLDKAKLLAKAEIHVKIEEQYGYSLPELAKLVVEADATCQRIEDEYKHKYWEEIIVFGSTPEK